MSIRNVANSSGDEMSRRETLQNPRFLKSLIDSLTDIGGLHPRYIVIKLVVFIGILFDVGAVATLTKNAINGTLLSDTDTAFSQLLIMVVLFGVIVFFYYFFKEKNTDSAPVLTLFGSLYILLASVMYAGLSYHMIVEPRHGFMTQLAYIGLVGIVAIFGYGLCLMSGIVPAWLGLPFMVVFLFQACLLVFMIYLDQIRPFNLALMGNLILVLFSGIFALALQDPARVLHSLPRR